MDSKDLTSHSKTSDDDVHVLGPLATKAASKQPAGHDGAVPDSDLQIPVNPSGNLGWAVQFGQDGQQQADQQDGLRMSQGNQRNPAGQPGSQAGAVSLNINATPSHQRCSFQRRLSLDASPIDLLTPSPGAADSVATPTFSEWSEVCDLT